MTVIQTCMQCGAVNGPEANACCFCDARLPKSKHEDIPVRASQPPGVEGNLATAPDWQSPDWQDEISHRLEAYRARRRRLQGDASQPEFSFEKNGVVEDDYVPTPAPQGPMSAVRARPIRLKNSTRSDMDRLDINVSQPAFDFIAGERHPAPARPSSSGQSAPFSHVAPLAQRRRAGLVDAALLIFAFGGFWSLFTALGGHFTISSFSAVVTVATLSLLYAQYFSLFTYFGGSTPGMMLCRLHVVSFDGSEPTSQQLLWRSFGYLVSGGTGALGFVWALWDEDHLTWHDRISQTYLALVSEAHDAGDDAADAEDRALAGR